MSDQERIVHLEQQVTYLQERNTELVEKNLELLSLLKKQSGQSSIRQAFRLYWYLEGGETKTEALKAMLADLKEFTSQSRDNIPWSAIDPALATLERERDEARYWLVKLYSAIGDINDQPRTRALVRDYLWRVSLYRVFNYDAVQALIAKVEGES